MQRAKLDVFQYEDYLSYLHEYAKGMQASNPHWSIGAWSKHLGLETTSSLSKILQGKRCPGPKIIGKLIGYFQFSEIEEVYFRDLVRASRFKKADDRRLSFIVTSEERIAEIALFLNSVKQEFEQRFSVPGGDRVVAIDMRFAQVARKPTTKH